MKIKMKKLLMKLEKVYKILKKKKSKYNLKFLNLFPKKKFFLKNAKSGLSTLYKTQNKI